MYTSPTPADLLELAVAVAQVAHSGQTRRGNGEPYWRHLDRVALAARQHGLRAATVAYLHDTVEDTVITPETLRQLFGAAIAHDVTMLTRNPELEATQDDGYMHYIGRLIEGGSDVALYVKLADLEDNLSSLDELPDQLEAARLRKRYTKAETYVRSELERRRTAPVERAV